jgi:hypothetical protein
MENDKVKYVVSCDYDLKLNNAALCMAHKETHSGNQVYIVDLIKTWERKPGNATSLQDIENEIMDLHNQHFNISLVNFDPFCSAQTMLRLTKFGLIVQRQSVYQKYVWDLFFEVLPEIIFRCDTSYFIDYIKNMVVLNGIRVDCQSNKLNCTINSVCSSVFSLASDQRLGGLK